MRLKAGTTGSSHAWHGVLRESGKVIWTCDHSHRNRATNHLPLPRMSCRSRSTRLNFSALFFSIASKRFS